VIEFAPWGWIGLGEAGENLFGFTGPAH